MAEAVAEPVAEVLPEEEPSFFELRDSSVVIKRIGGIEGEELVLKFHKTNRLPYEGGPYGLPPSLGQFPFELVSNHLERVIPPNWRKYQGVFFPMNDREAFWISFGQQGRYAKAVKMSSGRINVLTGEKWVDELQDPQDYFVVGHPSTSQPWIDGHHVGPGLIRQFVATPKGSGQSVEAQISGGEEKYGGVQFLVYLAKEPCREAPPPPPPPPVASAGGSGDSSSTPPAAAPELAEGADERTKSVHMAKVAEQAENYRGMADCMKEVAVLNVEMTVEERNLFSVAYKNLVGIQRASWRAFCSAEKELQKQADADQDRLASVKADKEKAEEEIASICHEIIGLLDDHLIPSCNSDESNVFFYKLKGDYYRYLAEFLTSESESPESPMSETAKEAKTAYLTAMKFSLQLSTTHPVRLGLALNYSVFLIEIEKDPAKACAIAKGGFENAIEELDTLTEEEYKDSTLIMQLLKDNLTLWTNEGEEEDGDLEECDDESAAPAPVVQAQKPSEASPPPSSTTPPEKLGSEPIGEDAADADDHEEEGEVEQTNEEEEGEAEEEEAGEEEVKETPPPPRRLPKQTKPPQEMSLAAGGLMKQEINPDPAGLDYWNQEKVGSVLWIHILSAQGFYEVTGKLVDGAVPEAWTTDMASAPIENPVDIAVPEVMSAIKGLGELDAAEEKEHK